MKTKTLFYRFHTTDNLLDSKNFNNIKKVRCIALNEQGLACMVSNDGVTDWMVPGGTVEKNENPILALKRELLEEADIEIKNYKLIGFMEAEFKNLLTGYTSRYTEMWFVANVSKILTQTEDPAKGKILEREFFDIEEMAYKFQKWGRISKFMVEFLTKLKVKSEK